MSGTSSRSLKHRINMDIVDMPTDAFGNNKCAV